MTPLRLARLATLAGWFGLFALLLLWNVLAQEPGRTSASAVPLLACLPLLMGLRGMLHGRPLTHALLALTAIVYALHGGMALLHHELRPALAAWELLCALLLLGGGAYYARLRARQVRAGAQTSVT